MAGTIPIKYQVHYTGGRGLGAYERVMPGIARDRRMAKYVAAGPEQIEQARKGIETTENAKTLRDIINSDAEHPAQWGGGQDTMGPAGFEGNYRPIEKPGGYDPDTNIASAVRSFGRNFVPGADYITAAGAWLEHPEVPFAKHLAEQRYWNKQAESDMPTAAMAGIGTQAAIMPTSKVPGLGGALSRIGTTGATNAIMDLTRGEDPADVLESTKRGAVLNAGLEAASPWIGHLLSHIPDAGRRALETNPVHSGLGLVASRTTARDLASKAKMEGGFSWSPGPSHEVTSGYALSTRPELGTIDPSLGAGSLGRYINRNEATLAKDPSAIVGGWRNPETGNWEMDVSKVVKDREQALREASAAHQKAIYDLGGHQTIPVPGSGFGEAAAGAPVMSDAQIAQLHQQMAATAASAKAPGVAERAEQWVADHMMGSHTPNVEANIVGEPGWQSLYDTNPMVRQMGQGSPRYQAPERSVPLRYQIQNDQTRAAVDASEAAPKKMADGGWTPPLPPAALTPDQLGGDPGAAPAPTNWLGGSPSQGTIGVRNFLAGHGDFNMHPDPLPVSVPAGGAPMVPSARMGASHSTPPGMMPSHSPPTPGGFDFGTPPPPQSAFDPYAGIVGMMQPPSGAINEIARSQQQQALQQADLEGSKAAWSQEQMKWYNDARSKVDTEYNATVEDYKNSHIEPGKVFNDRSTPQKAMAMIGMILGGMGSGLTGQPNMAANMIQRQIEMDLQAQVQNMDKKRNLVAMNYQKYGNLDQALRVSYMQQAAYYESKIHQVAATSNAAQAMPQAQVALWKLREPLIPVMVQMAQYQGLQNMMRSGGHVVGDMPAPWSWEQYMATAMPGPGGRTTFARSPEDRKAAVEGLQKWDAYGQAVNQLDQHRSIAAAIPLTDAQHQYDQYREAAVLALANAQGVGRGEALKMVNSIAPGSVQQFVRGPESLQALRDIGANGKWSIWETHGSLHRPQLKPAR